MLLPSAGMKGKTSACASLCCKRMTRLCGQLGDKIRRPSRCSNPLDRLWRLSGRSGLVRETDFEEGGGREEFMQEQGFFSPEDLVT